MHILIIGAAGMVGRKLTAALVKAGTLGGKPIEQLTLADVVAPEAPAFAGKVETKVADLPAPGIAA
jgi:D-erythronate 2-dehydrogenase